MKSEYKKKLLYNIIKRRITVGTIIDFGNYYYIVVGYIKTNKHIFGFQVKEVVTVDVLRRELRNRNFLELKLSEVVIGNERTYNNNEFRIEIENYKDSFIIQKYVRDLYDYIETLKIQILLRDGTILESGVNKFIVLACEKKIVLLRVDKKLTAKQIKEKIISKKSDRIEYDSIRFLREYQYIGFVDISKEVLKLRMLGEL